MKVIDLSRFLQAQQACYQSVRSELVNGRKRSHWMWFIFPQVSGLGSSPMAVQYAIQSVDEARAYLEHRILGPRLIELTGILLSHENLSAELILGGIDAMKFRSSMTLFAALSDTGSPFDQALVRFYSGQRDPFTLEWLLQRRTAR